MKMIDRFIDLANLVNSNRVKPSLITKWKIQHRKYEILSELKKKTEFSAQDIYNYTWVANYSSAKYFKSISYPDGFTIYIINRFLRIKFDKKDTYPKFKITINGDGNNPDSIEIIYCRDALYHYYLSYDKIDTSEKIDRSLFNILKELFMYTTSAVIDKLIKGE